VRLSSLRERPFAILPGQYFDAETGLHQNRFRDFDPSTGRYLQSDPIGLRGGISTYSYAGSNPLAYTDTSGLRIDWGGYAFSNLITSSNFQLLNMNLVQDGFQDDCFVLRVTGGDRYRDPEDPSVIRSSTNDEVVSDASQTSPHLVERGARAVDFSLENVSSGSCKCSKRVTNADVDAALKRTEFLPANTERDYPNAPHTHVATPPGSRYAYGP